MLPPFHGEHHEPQDLTGGTQGFCCGRHGHRSSTQFNQEEVVPHPDLKGTTSTRPSGPSRKEIAMLPSIFAIVDLVAAVVVIVDYFSDKK